MEERLLAIETLVKALGADVKNLLDQLAAGFTKVDNNFNSVKGEIKGLHFQLNQLNKRVDALRGDTEVGLDDVGVKIENLSEEITKIGKVTNYDEMYNNLRMIK